MKKILLTGATGFLGSNLLKSLIEKTNFEVVVLKRSFSNTSRVEHLLDSPRISFYDLDKVSLEDVFIQNEIETIIHCATNYGRNNEDVLNILQSNLMLPLNIFQLALKYKVKSFINTDTILDKDISYYSLSKSQFWDWLKMESGQIKCVNLSLEHFYGANDNNTKFTTHIIKSLMNKVENLDLTKGEQKRYFIHIDDVVAAFLVVIQKLDDFENGFYNFNVSTEESISVKDFVLLVKKLTGNTSTFINFGKIPYRKNEVMDFKVDLSQIKEIGWLSTVDLAVGLRQTIDEEMKGKKFYVLDKAIIDNGMESTTDYSYIRGS